MTILKSKTNAKHKKTGNSQKKKTKKKHNVQTTSSQAPTFIPLFQSDKRHREKEYLQKPALLSGEDEI